MAIIEKLLDVISPTICVGCGSEGSAICKTCTSVNLLPYGGRCYGCNRLMPASKTCAKCAHRGGPRHLWISTNYDDLAEQLVEHYKFNSHRAAAPAIAQIMIDQLPSNRLESYVVVPVPTAGLRHRERGFDHTRLLARTISRDLGLRHIDALVHVGQARQVGATRTQRRQQAKESYRSTKDLRGLNILLIDDVVTTGATVEACSRLLRQAGAKRVDGLVFAKKL